MVREIDDNDPDAREYTAAAVCAVADCEPGTLRAWRRRNGLFPATMMSDGWTRFSLADMAATKLVVELTAAGIAAQIAVDIAMMLLPHLEQRMISTGNYPRGLERESEVHYIVAIDKKGKVSLTKHDSIADLKATFWASDQAAFLILNELNLTALPRFGLHDPDDVKPLSVAPKRRNVARSKSKTSALSRAKGGKRR